MRLRTAGLAYSGQLYRQVAENTGQIPHPEKHVVFVGFNAFTLTEEKLIKHFVKEFGAEIFWDVDGYYLDDRLQEAGLFFRDYQKDAVLGKTFPEVIPALISQKVAQIHTYAIPLKTNQANLVGKILESVNADEALEETVIILPDEQLLFSVLHSMPETISRLNVTMGYPIRNAPIYAFLDAVLDLQRFAKWKGGKIFFYYRPVLDLLSFSYLETANSEFASQLFEKIKTENLLDVPVEAWAKEGTLFQLVFQKVEAQDLFDYLGSIIQYLAQDLKEDVIQRSYLYQAFKQLNRLKEIFKTNLDKTTKMDFVLKLFRQIFRELKLPFEGEPLQGLQIMGVLESRNLDFRRVIICDVNEGSFPPGGGINSMIPFNLRRAFGLPVQEQNDAIYAYTFYRLLHRAKEVHLIYTTAADQGKANEVSRFVQQMQAELHISKPKPVMIPVELTPSKEIRLEKTPEILDRLALYLKKEEGDPFAKSFSASALSMYLDCRLRFYFRYVAELKEKEEVVSEIDPMTFGTLLHSAIELLYAVDEGKSYRDIDSHTIDRLLPQVPETVDKAIRKFYQKENEEELELSGQLVIAREVLIKYVKEILRYDQKNGPFRVIGLEKKYLAGISVETPQGRVELALQGVIDRMDIKDGVVRLLDYKTGKDSKKVNSIASLFAREDDHRNKAAMQTLLYAYFYQQSHPENQLPLKPGIFNIKEIYDPKFNPFLVMNKEEIRDYRDFAEEFELGLSGLLAEIFNPEVPFDQTEDEKKCTYCAYKEICGR